jgi:hypothetical protein
MRIEGMTDTDCFIDKLYNDINYLTLEVTWQATMH